MRCAICKAGQNISGFIFYNDKGRHLCRNCRKQEEKMKKEPINDEFIEEEEQDGISHLVTYEDLVGALGKEIKSFLESPEFMQVQKHMVDNVQHRQTCERCGKVATAIYVKDLKFLLCKSTFPFDYAVLCDTCVPKLAIRLKDLVG